MGMKVIGNTGIQGGSVKAEWKVLDFDGKRGAPPGGLALDGRLLIPPPVQALLWLELKLSTSSQRWRA